MAVATGLSQGGLWSWLLFRMSVCGEENTLECSAKNGSCTCKSGYQGNRCQKASAVSRLLASLSKRKEITLQENLTLRRLKLANHLFELK